MNRTALLFTGGLYHLAFAVFHLGFWKLFRWKSTLRLTTPLNRSVMQVMNLCLVYGFSVVAFVSILFAGRMTASPVPSLSIAGFWLFRALLQILFFDVKNAPSVALTAFFLVGAMIYGMVAYSILYG